MLITVRRFLWNFLPLISFRVGALVLSFAISLLLARGLGPAGYGVYAFAIAIFTIAQPLAGGGLGALSVRELADPSLSTKEKSTLINLFVTISIVTSLIVGTLIAIAAPVIFPDKSAILTLAFLILPGFVLVETSRGILSGQHKIKTGQFLSELLRPGLYATIILGLAFLHQKVLSPVSAMLAFGLVSWLIGLVALRYTHICVRLPISLETLRVQGAQIIRRSLPFAMISAMQYLNTRLDVLAIGYLMANESVGHYQVATKVAGFVSMPASLVAILAAPRISAAFRGHKYAQLRSLFWKMQLAAVVLALPVFGIFVVFGGQIIRLGFGVEFLPAVPPMNILLILQLLLSGIAAVAVLKSMVGQEKSVLFTLLGTAVGNIILNAVLIPRYGIVGAATATATMGMVTFVILSLSLYRSGVLSRRRQP